MNRGVMDYKAQNRQAVIDYILQGAHEVCDKLGVEVEHFVVTEDGTDVSYRGRDGQPGVADILEHLSQYYPERSYNDEGDLLGLASEDGSITLEPAAQVEISIAPFAQVEDVLAAYQRFRDRIDPFLAQHKMKLVHGGYHPTKKAFDLTLIPKRRYAFMDAYFTEIGTVGHRMMRASASTQVSVDFRDEADAVRKIRVANALAPILAVIADGTTVFEAESIKRPIARFDLWRQVDSLRCGVVPGLFDEGFGVGSYVDWIMGTRPIFVTRPAANDPSSLALRADEGKAAADLYADAPMSKDDVEHVLSMFWPDVRLKRFVEIRPADSLPAAIMAGYTSLVKGLFYSEESLAAIERALGVKDGVWAIGKADIDAAVESIFKDGFKASCYGNPLVAWIELLFSLAARALAADEAGYLDELHEYALHKNWGSIEDAGAASERTVLTEKLGISALGN